MKKMLFVALLICTLTNVTTAQETNDIAILTNVSTNNAPAESDKLTLDNAEAKYTLESYGSTQPVNNAFEVEHFLGGDTSIKWNLFLQSYKRVYEQTVGLSGSSVEILKPTVFNAVNKVNDYYKKLLNNKKGDKEQITGELNHILDCANLLCYEEDTKSIETDIKNAKTIPDIVLVFASIHIIQH